ncbi:NAD(P)-dependent oxidoreductase [Pseudoalteromonas phenolica]|uniref:NAD(P)-dependent oxidoreductase n=1 Tax=Pseudoalteromonas phenolica TaxID=161398 RepID=A0A4Q7II57_9GAMM|nr:SDR family oxidoreductase [Pseudoalteromonas phenolica]RZQ51754.1 NAD(P)-dependent oxidoreductase [Pseudoalteromonas phenolica]TMN86564.1 NAD(P)-dependent oxidoreductase [Pseudoalteromonas phenolica]
MAKKKVALITGASRGIGAATARLFAKHGYIVCVNYLSNNCAANNVVDEIILNGGSAIAIQADVNKESEVQALFDTISSQLGSIDVLINNAGILRAQSRFVDLNEERITQILTGNILSYFLCSKYAVQTMSSDFGGNGGSIVNVSSAASRTGAPNEYIDYAASKGAIDTLTIGLAKEVAAQGIRVNCVRPGLIYTDMHADGGEPNRVDRLKSKLPMQRGGEPEEVAEAIYWLASNKASYATGNFIDLAGGL